MVSDFLKLAKILSSNIINEHCRLFDIFQMLANLLLTYCFRSWGEWYSCWHYDQYSAYNNKPIPSMCFFIKYIIKIIVNLLIATKMGLLTSKSCVVWSLVVVRMAIELKYHNTPQIQQPQIWLCFNKQQQ